MIGKFGRAHPVLEASFLVHGDQEEAGYCWREKIKQVGTGGTERDWESILFTEGSPILMVMVPPGVVVPKWQLLYLVVPPELSEAFSGEGDFCNLPPSKAAGSQWVFFSLRQLFCRRRLEELLVWLYRLT